MRILAAVIAHPWRKVSGATNAALQLSQHAASLCDIEAAVMWDRAGRVTEGGLTVTHLASRDRTGPLLAWAPRGVRVPLQTADFAGVLRGGKYDLVHIHNLIPTLAALDLARACARAGVPYVISTHGFYELVNYASIRKFGPLRSLAAHLLITRPFRKVVAGCARFFMLSPNEADLLASLGVPAQRRAVVTNGVNPFYLDQPSPEEVRSARSKWALGEGEPTILFMGSLHDYKGVDVLLRSLTHSAVRPRVVVAGSFKRDGEREALLARCLPPAEHGRVTFTGRVSDEELRALYRLADVFVYPTRGDTLPLVVLEAMAQGTPVVATPIAGIPYEVTPECGRLVPVDDPAATAGAYDALLRDAALRKALGEAAGMRVREVFTWPGAAEAAVAEYRRVLGDG